MEVDFTTTTMQEVEFLTEEEIVEVLPNTRLSRLHFISGTFGPFSPQVPVGVPLWLALTLKQMGKATLQCPAWMAPDELREVLRFERDHQQTLYKLPRHFVGIATLLLHAASEDIPDAELIRQLIRDIEEVRAAKLKAGRDSVLHRLAQGGSGNLVILTGLSALEAEHIRHDFLPLLDALTQHKRVGQSAQSSAALQARSATGQAQSAARPSFAQAQGGTAALPVSARSGVSSDLRSRFTSATAPARASAGASAGEGGDRAKVRRGAEGQGDAAAAATAAAEQQEDAGVGVAGEQGGNVREADGGEG